MRNFSILCVSLIIIFVLVIGCGKQTEEQMYTIAEKFEKEEKFEDALVKYEKILVEYPESELTADVYFKIAQISGNLKRYEKCVDAYSRIVKAYPENAISPKAQFMIGYIYANELKDETKAKEAYNLFLEKYSSIDSGMTASAKFELKFMGKDISEIDFLEGLTSDKEAEKAAK